MSKVSDDLTFGVLKTPKVFFCNHGYSQIDTDKVSHFWNWGMMIL
ncbi:hypothetical protein A33Q_3352 [Indibacter alkaliphilus LW1]|uniref:Uncharacterized protein n=1 Tax=Indibacter alkaliphilus (strain CCUG 57479 / KCTC 22604 / LW1) TaxID=1189612 RepID=S2D7G5_INDAL|nr:hypothetical protein A33Q_3352 [Indibacter alkaliphilus LW1]